MLAQTKQRLTYITIGAYFFLGGIEYAVILPTLWLYLNTVFHAPPYLFGIILSSFSITDLFSGLLLGRISDKTHQTKLFLIITNVFQVVGSFLYIIDVGPEFLIISRMITGFGSGVSASLMGDLARVISASERTSTLAVFFALRQVGLVIGPGCNIFLSKFDFSFGPYHVNKFTSPGFFMMILWMVHELMSLFMFWNLPQLKYEDQLRTAQMSNTTTTVPSFNHADPNFCPNDLNGRRGNYSINNDVGDNDNDVRYGDDSYVDDDASNDLDQRKISQCDNGDYKTVSDLFDTDGNDKEVKLLTPLPAIRGVLPLSPTDIKKLNCIDGDEIKFNQHPHSNGQMNSNISSNDKQRLADNFVFSPLINEGVNIVGGDHMSARPSDLNLLTKPECDERCRVITVKCVLKSQPHSLSKQVNTGNLPSILKFDYHDRSESHELVSSVQEFSYSDNFQNVHKNVRNPPNTHFSNEPDVNISIDSARDKNRGLNMLGGLKSKQPFPFHPPGNGVSSCLNVSHPYSCDSNDYMEIAEMLIKINTKLKCNRHLYCSTLMKKYMSKSHNDILSLAVDDYKDNPVLDSNLLSKHQSHPYHQPQPAHHHCQSQSKILTEDIEAGPANILTSRNDGSIDSNSMLLDNIHLNNNRCKTTDPDPKIHHKSDKPIAQRVHKPREPLFVGSGRGDNNNSNYGSCNTSSVFQSTMAVDSNTRNSDLTHAAILSSGSENEFNNHDGSRQLFRELFRPELIALLFAVFISFFNQLALEALLTPLTQKFLSWGEMENSYLYCAAGIEVILVFILIRPLSNKIEDKWLILIGSILQLICISVLMVYIPRAKDDEKIKNLILILLVVFVNLIGLPMLMLCCNSLFTKLVPSKIQGFCQGVRKAFGGVGTILGPLWAGGTIYNPLLMFGMMAAVNCIALMLLASSFKELTPPTSERSPRHVTIQCPPSSSSSPLSESYHPGSDDDDDEVSISERTSLLRA